MSHLLRALLASVAACALAVVALPAHGGLQETFDAANEAFWSGEHEAAVGHYEELVQLGVRDPEVFFNLGTAHARLGRYGPAILNLERALRLEPGHEDARHNLGAVRRALARQRTAGGEDADLHPPRSFWMNLLARVTPSQVGIPLLLCWVGLFIVLGVRRFLSRELPRLVLLVIAPLLALAALTTGTLFASKAYYDTSVQEAIAVHSDLATVREGPADRFRRAFVVREGDRVRVLDEERGWIHIRDGEGNEGWGDSTDFGLLRL